MERVGTLGTVHRQRRHQRHPTSHTTGRTHDLGFRAATALFGHFGIEWDLRRASERDLAELSAWVAFHKQQRDLLHRGDLVRLDFPDASLTATAVIAPDRSRALYSFASVDRADVVLLGRLRFPGLDPDRRYRVRPLMVGTPRPACSRLRGGAWGRPWDRGPAAAPRGRTPGSSSPEGS